MNERQVFFNCEPNFITPLCVVIDSLLVHSNADKPLTIHVATNTEFINARLNERIEAIVSRYPFAKVEFHDFSPIFMRHQNELCSESKWPPLVWAFPLFTELLPEITGNVVYLDVDMFIRKDLEELYSLDLAGMGYIAAAVNECPREMRAALEDCEWPKAAGVYFNNGTMVVNADMYRREHIAERIPELYNKYKQKFYGVDQDLQNVTLGAKTLRLPLKWNYSDTWLEQLPKRDIFADNWLSHRPKDVIDATIDPCIVHFMGRFKPWNYTHRPERLEYRATLRKLGLIKKRLPGETPLKTIEGAFFDAYHWLLKRYACRLQARLARGR